MTKTWDSGWQHDGEAYQLRLYEDVRGEQPNVFVVERGDGQSMTADEARWVHAALEIDAGYGAGESRLWEQAPDGRLYEHTFREFQYDAGSIQQDLPVQEYYQDLSSGKVEANIATGHYHTKTEISPEKASEITECGIQTYEHQIQQDWRDLRAPDVGY